jgi:Flp pilus assembly pilin Flp
LDEDDDMFQRISDRLRQRFGKPDSGQDLLEYALLVALIVIVVMTAVSPVGTTIKTVFWDAIATTTGTI